MTSATLRRFIPYGVILLFLAALHTAFAQGQAEYAESQPDCKQIQSVESLGKQTGGLFDAVTTSLSKRLDPWSLNSFKRGQKIEEAAAKVLPGHLRPNFPGIDFFSQGTATSMKSLDPRAATYQQTSAIVQRIAGWVRTLEWFCSTGKTAGGEVRCADVKRRQLRLVVPPCLDKTNVKNLRAAVNEAAKNAAKQGVDVVINYAW